MPTRILREGIITSEAVAQLSFLAELFYRKLMSVADDYGRFHANPAILVAYCYPLAATRVTLDEISGYVKECESTTPPLIVVYGPENKRCLQIDNFGQHKRAKRSKFPEPPQTIASQEVMCNGDDLQLIENVNNAQTMLLQGNINVTPNAIHTHVTSAQTCASSHTHTHPTTSPSLGGAGGGRLRCIPQDEAEVVAYGQSRNPPIEESLCREFFSYYEGQAARNAAGDVMWVTGKGMMVSNWRAKLPYFKGSESFSHGAAARRRIEPDHSKF